MVPFDGSTREEPSDTLLGQLLDSLERDPEAFLARLTDLQPALGERVARLVHVLRDARLLPTSLRFGRFVADVPLGHGSMGVVWKARDPELGRDVAIKVLAAHLLARPAAVERFAREARAIAALRHPGIVTIHEIGSEAGVPFLVMELIDGGTLAERILDDRSQLRSVDVACRIGVALAEALHAAHLAGILHRDVKPSNVLLRASGAPLLTDFGLACIDGDPTLTATGDLLGTPAFAAPELLLDGQADPRSDVYSLAATLHALVLGRPPKAATAVRLLIRGDAMTAPTKQGAEDELPTDFRIVLTRALSADPQQRHPTARAFGEDLGRVLRGEPVSSRRRRVLVRFGRWARAHPAQATAVFLPIALVVAFTTAFIWWQRQQLDRYELLSDAHIAQTLVDEVATLWPALPHTAPRMEQWLQRATALRARESAHRREQVRLGSLASDRSGPQPRFADEELAWRYHLLTESLARSDELQRLIPIIEHRLDHALHVEERTLGDPEARAAWAATIESIRTSPRYGGLEMRPRLGLLPLGEDPRSGLWEFWCPVTGERPLPAPATSAGRWTINAETAMVFVLVPGGTYTVGADRPSAEHPADDPFVDGGFFKIEAPRVAVRLDAYMIGKYEVTQAQWERLTGRRPSHWDYGVRPDLGRPTCPVERVSWAEASAVLTASGMTLPTDVQWEVAYRAGSTSVYPQGDDETSMFGAANVQDLSWKRHERATVPVAPCDDGFVVTAPAGSLPPNPFGLHEMAGNVAELCADGQPDDPTSPRPGDGRFDAGAGRLRLVRGASWGEGFSRARSAYRDVVMMDQIASTIGVRAAIALSD